MEGKVNGPAIGLMVTAGLGVLGALISIVLTLVPIGGDPADMYGEQFAFLSGAIQIGLNVIGIAVCGFIFWASIEAMIPCLSPCCIVGLPIGIWAIIVLMKDEVKSAFKA